MSILSISKKAEEINVSCFGEVLWDCFDSDKRLGGAPLNMCLRVSSLGIKAQMISAIGNDELGEALLREIKAKGLSTDFISTHKSKPTSIVEVELDKKGSAMYQIKTDTAWDDIYLSDQVMDKVANSDVFVFGSLIARTDSSFETLENLLDCAKFKVFDVNLRSPHYRLKRLLTLMNKADFIKMNDEELYELAELMGSKYNSLEQNLKFIATVTNTQYLCVTKGRHGAVLSINGENYYNSGYHVKVVDTVGAGDAFLGSLIYQLCIESTPQYAVDFACAVGAMVAQTQGATPVYSQQQITRFIEP